MLARYHEIIYTPTIFNPSVLAPTRRVKWDVVRKDVKRAWDWLQAKIRPTENPFDTALRDVFQEMLFEGI